MQARPPSKEQEIISALEDVCSVINRLRDAGVVEAYAVGGAKRRERAYQLLESGDVDRLLLRDILARHGLSTEILDGA